MNLYSLEILYRSISVFVSLSVLWDAPWWSVLSLRASHTLSHPHTKLWQQLGFTAPQPTGFTRQTDPSRCKPISRKQRGQVRACLECSPAPSRGWSPFSTPKRTCTLLHSWTSLFPIWRSSLFSVIYILSVKKTTAIQRVLRRWEGSGLQSEEKDRHVIHAVVYRDDRWKDSRCSQATLF